MKDTNPKDAIGTGKLPLHLWPETATALGCLGMLDGALKYGRSNWRASGVRLSIYVDALRRHVNAMYEGEDFDPDSGLPHISHALACLAIVADAHAMGMLVDDRPGPGGYRKLVDRLTPHVARMKELRAGCSPRHFTLEQPDTTIHVVVGVLRKGPKGRRKGDGGTRESIFLQRRPLHDENFPGAWECPGGGVEPGETDREALTRELREECGIDAHVVDGPPLWRGQIVGYKGGRHDFRFYDVAEWEGKPGAHDGQPNTGWFPAKKPPMGLTPANLLAWPEIVR